ncbi:ABC-type spermidine/putrescine transport system permease subunit I [Oceanotoga teriensis]|jgi:spermidine/putrescine transport system permease protein|uniref:ABC-type spermidine/putrescine transport system permease subunit I n=1 Tax=Oceanotoga teriensis TaxID=515440 RepID=A0AA45HHL7_9BACT|nr:ABC transporter permease [Oceanotoga teriensis]PWJ87525.1 ABC-type spermidine/putrescine transport system permease subunit I [Oceanotoga teriensis]
MKKKYGITYITPFILWTTLFFILPTTIIFIYSFLKKALYGGVDWQLSFKAYIDLFDISLLKIFLNTSFVAIVSTIITIFFAIPSAYYIARSNHKDKLIFFIIIPFWTNFLVRIYSWIAILGNNGLLNQILLKFRIIDDYLMFLYNNGSIITVMVYTYLPYAILPLFSTIEKFDFSLLEAARDLGATKSESIFKVFLPNIKTGIYTAMIFTFIPAFGNYAIPQLVGGINSMMIGNVISRELMITRNWPLASAISVFITIITVSGILIFMNKNDKKKKVVL